MYKFMYLKCFVKNLKKLSQLCQRSCDLNKEVCYSSERALHFNREKKQEFTHTELRHDTATVNTTPHNKQ